MSRKREASRPLIPRGMDAKHASLMQDYLQLQDEFDALKERLQTTKMRKATLLAEARFLRRRLKKLKESPLDRLASIIPQCDSFKARSGKSVSVAVAVPQPSNMPPMNNLLGSRGIPVFCEPLIISGSDESAKLKPVNGNVGLVSALKSPVLRDSSNLFVTAMAGKRKISWQDQISLKCN